MTDSVMINLRIGRAEKKRLAEIARLEGSALSSMIRSAAVLAARRVLAEFTVHAPPNKQKSRRPFRTTAP